MLANMGYCKNISLPGKACGGAGGACAGGAGDADGAYEGCAGGAGGAGGDHDYPSFAVLQSKSPDMAVASVRCFHKLLQWE